ERSSSPIFSSSGPSQASLRREKTREKEALCGARATPNGQRYEGGRDSRCAPVDAISLGAGGEDSGREAGPKCPLSGDHSGRVASAEGAGGDQEWAGCGLNCANCRSSCVAPRLDQV